jgi:hypothetical protein
MSDDRLAGIAERVRLWRDQDEPGAAITLDDAEDLLADAYAYRRARHHDTGTAAAAAAASRKVPIYDHHQAAAQADLEAAAAEWNQEPALG